MAEGIEFGNFDDLTDEILGPEDEILEPEDEILEPEDDVFIDIPPADSTSIRYEEAALGSLTGDPLIAARRELLKTKVDAFLKVVADRDGLLPGPHVYDEFVLGADGRALYLKNGLKQVTWKTNSTRYLALQSLGTADFIRTHLFPEYVTRRAKPTGQQIVALTAADSQVTDALQGIEMVELQDLPQRASNVDIAIQTLVAEQETSFGGLPEREILGLNEALKRTRGALVDNLAKLSQLDADITQAEQELEGEEAVNNPEKKRRIQELLNRLRDERSSRLEAAAANREALRTQFSRIRETIERVLNEDTTLAERLRTLFREQGVTIVSILTAFGMVVSTLVLALTGGSGGIPPPTPPAGKGGFKEWMKKHLQSLGRALAKLASKAAVTLPGIIGSIVSWLLNLLAKTAGWLAGNVWVVVLAVGGLLLADAREWFEKPKHA